MPEKYYKVVAVTKANKLRSAVMSDPRIKKWAINNLCLTYKIGRWIRPKIRTSKIFVFDSPRSAECFRKERDRQDELQVFECQAKNPERLDYGVYVMENNFASLFRQFWKRPFTRNRDPMRFPYTPTGTYAADAVKLVRRVYPKR